MFAYHQVSYCQPKAKTWVKSLASRTDNENKAYDSLSSVLAKLDSTEVFSFLSELKNTGNNDPYFKARFNSLKASYLIKYNARPPYWASNYSDTIKKQVTHLFDDAIQQAYITDDDYSADINNCSSSVFCRLSNCDKRNGECVGDFTK